jgi:hypothetical protein
MKAYAAINLEKSDNQTEKAKYRKHLLDIGKLARVLIASDKISIPEEAYQHMRDLFNKGTEYFPKEKLKESGWKKDSTFEDLKKAIESNIFLLE